MVQPLDHGPDHFFQLREIEKQTDIVQLRTFERYLNSVVVSVGILTLALVTSQRVPGRKRLFHTHLKHRWLSFLFFLGKIQAGSSFFRNRSTSPKSCVLR